MRDYSLDQVEAVIDHAYVKVFNRLRKYNRRDLVRYALGHYEVTRTPAFRMGLYDPGVNEEAIDFLLGNLNGGLTYLVRWLMTSKGRKPIRSLTELETSEFFNLLQLAVAYSYANIYFTQTRRGSHSCRIDGKNRRIIFSIINNGDLAFKHYSSTVNGLILEDDLRIRESLDLFTTPNILAMKSRAPTLFHASERVDVQPFIKQILAYLQRTALIELDSDESLGEYTKEEFLLLYSVWIAVARYDVALQHAPKGAPMERFNPYPFESSYGLLSTSFSRLTGLDKVKVNAILQDFIFNSSKGSRRLSVKPIVKIDGIAMWSSSYVLRPYAGIIFSNLVYKDRKNDYDRLQEKLENHAVKSLTQEIEDLSSGDLKLVDVSVVLKSKTQLTPYIVFINSKDNSILIVEYKYFISAYGYEDVSSQFKSIGKAIKQLEQYVNLPFLDHLRPYGVIVSHHTVASPVPAIPTDGTSLLSRRMLLDIVERTALPDRIINFARSLHDLAHTRVKHKQIGSIGEWSIDHPILTGDFPIPSYSERLSSVV